MKEPQARKRGYSSVEQIQDRDIENSVGWKMLKITNFKMIERTFPPLNFGGNEHLTIIAFNVYSISHPTCYNLYMKAFKDGEEIKPYFSVARKASDGTFFSTHRPMGRNDFLKKYNNGQVIYHNLPDQTVITQKTSPASNILTDLARNFKTKLFDYMIKK